MMTQILTLNPDMGEGSGPLAVKRHISGITTRLHYTNTPMLHMPRTVHIYTLRNWPCCSPCCKVLAAQRLLHVARQDAAGHGSETGAAAHAAAHLVFEDLAEHPTQDCKLLLALRKTAAHLRAVAPLRCSVMVAKPADRNGCSAGTTSSAAAASPALLCREHAHFATSCALLSSLDSSRASVWLTCRLRTEQCAARCFDQSHVWRASLLRPPATVSFNTPPSFSSSRLRNL